ncbi:hypothetical protein LZ32DRAFT_661620 [Colletotrichum eremochloae]|nr:hypothetical protein LZ32DRAFT_661620 [Colletotrichum eremochloae]
MQFSILALLTFTMTITVSASTTTTANGNCRQGQNLFCGADSDVCPPDQKDTFDAKATKANEDACKGLQAGDQSLSKLDFKEMSYKFSKRRDKSDK